MKSLLNAIYTCLLLLVVATANSLIAQEPDKPELLVSIHYYNVNNNLQYLRVKTMVKENKKLLPVSESKLNLYLDKMSPENLIGQIQTDDKGEGRIAIPPALQNQWKDTTDHTFIALHEATRKFIETTTTLDIKKAKIVVDTLNENGVRKLVAQVMALENEVWVPAKDVELKMGVRRMGGDLIIGGEETYTTDSTGQAIGDFILEKLPAAAANNNITLVVKTEDNELFGNVSVEMTAPWGEFVQQQNNFNQRSLFATGNRSPLWLLFIVFSIVAGVWGVILYLILLLVKIKRAGRSNNQAVAATPVEIKIVSV